ncbi:MAG: TetR/AcrR family transcriptional regulator [Ignavibacteriales bacterium]
MDNKHNILSVALDLFCSGGYDAVGVQEIVEASGVTKPTLYHYFGSKRGLLDEVLKERFMLLHESVKEAAAYRGDLPMNLTEVTRVFFSFAREEKKFYRMQLAMCFSSPESEAFKAVTKYNENLIRLLEQMFLLASNDHGNMKGREKRYAFSFMGAINSYITLFLSGHLSLDDNMIYQAVHQFSHGIYS